MNVARRSWSFTEVTPIVSQNSRISARNLLLISGSEIVKKLAISKARGMEAVITRILREVRVAQLHLIKDSQASKWGKPFLLPVTK